MPIVVGVDGSAGASTALRWARAEAAARGCGLTALLAYGFYGRPRAVDEGAPGADADGLRKAAAAVLAEAVAGASAEDDQGPPVAMQVSADEPVDALLGSVGAGDVLVLGARGLGPVRRVLLGSVGLDCARHAPCAVVVVREAKRDAGGPVVVGVDGSAESIEALTWAAEHARVRKLPLVVVRAWSRLPGPAPKLATPPSSTSQPEHDVAALEPIVSAIAAASVDVSLRLEDGQPAPVLLESAAGAQLLVVGSRGLGGFNRLLLGSTSTACLVHSPGNVAVVAHREPHPPASGEEGGR